MKAMLLQGPPSRKQKRGLLAAPQSPDKRTETKQAGPLSEREADRLHAEQTHGLSDIRDQNNHEHHRRDVFNNDRPHIGQTETSRHAHLVDERLGLDNPAHENAGKKRSDRHHHRVGDEVVS